MIFLATPVWRYLDVRAAHSITAAIAMNAPEETVWWETIDGDALISRTRSQLATKFLMDERLKDADVMVILDDDVQFEPSDLWRIVQGARRTGDLYGGVYVTRSREPHPASLGYPDQKMTFQRAEEPVPIEIRYLATGFMAIPRKVCEAMIAKEYQDADGAHILHYCEQGVGELHMWDFFRPFVIWDEFAEKYHYLSEDWAFCERARQCGFKVWADQSIILGHRAMVTITVADLRGTGHALSKDGAPSKGSSVLMTQPNVGSDTEVLASSR